MKILPGLLALSTLLSPAIAQSAVVTFQEGADNEFVTGYTGTSDTQLSGNSSTAVAGGLESFLVGRNQTRTSLIRFDLSSLQGATASISSATITLMRTGNATTADFDIEIRGVASTNGGWNEMTASWGNFDQPTTTKWQNAAGEDQTSFFGAAGSLYQTISYTTTTESITFNIPLDVLEQWINNPSSASGLALVPVGSNGPTSIAAGFASSENETFADRPLLTIHYTAIPEPSSIALIGLSGLGLMGALSRKRSKAAALPPKA